MSKEFYLCGGVFFLLLQNSAYKKRTSAEHLTGLTDDHSNTNIMRDLVYVFTGNQIKSPSTDCSRYTNCKSEGSIRVPFNDSAVADAFDYDIRTDYAKPLSRMKDFIDWHIREEMYTWLIRAVLDLLKEDEMPLNQELFCIPDGSSVTKEELLTQDNYCLDAFLLGVLHYILEYRSGRNCEGEETLNTISTQRGNSRKYESDLGKDIKRIINVYRYTPKTATLQEGTASSSNIQEEQPDEIGAQETINDDSDMSSRQSINSTIINNQTYIENQTTNNINIDNSEVTLNL